MDLVPRRRGHHPLRQSLKRNIWRLRKFLLEHVIAKFPDAFWPFMSAAVVLVAFVEEYRMGGLTTRIMIIPVGVGAVMGLMYWRGQTDVDEGYDEEEDGGALAEGVDEEADANELDAIEEESQRQSPGHTGGGEEYFEEVDELEPENDGLKEV